MYSTSRKWSRPFGPDGCQVPVGKGICGETRTLDIINEFKRLYQEKIKEIDNAGGGDCLQEKLKLQQEWIGDLTEQNEMLVRAVEELEHEATERVNLLEEKLQQSAQCICEVMNRYRAYDVTSELLKEPQQRIFQLNNDLKNLLEFLRRIREDNVWTTGGLNFYEISSQDLFGDKSEGNFRYLIGDTAKEESKVKDRESTIQELQTKVGDVDNLRRELNCKREECEALQKEMEDMRHVLTEEVAAKHDVVLKLKRDCQELEDRCIQADKQTAFRDDIIKELRKEIKQLKQQDCICLAGQKVSLESKLTTLEKEKKSLELCVKDEKIQIMGLERQFQEFLQDRAQLKEKCKTYEKERQCMQEECKKLKSQNDTFKQECDCLNVKISKYANDKKLIEVEMKQLKDDLNNFLKAENNCVGKVENLSAENKKLMNELCKMNQENRKLLNTVDEQKKQIVAIRVTQDEIVKLTSTIDELQRNLQRIMQQREEEEKRYLEKICNLNNKLKETEDNLQDAQEKSKVCKICRGRSKVGFADNTEVQTDDVADELEDNFQLDLIVHRDNIIKSQNDTLNMMQRELETLKETELELRSEIDRCCENNECLKNRINELENSGTDDEVEKMLEVVQNRDEIIRNQNETLNLMQLELESLKESEKNIRLEREKYCQSILHLKERISELEVTLQNSDGRADNLQMAVDLYMNSINVLEASEEKYKIEIDQQRATISNLQRALVDAKQELDNFKKKCEDNQLDQQELTTRFFSVLDDIEREKDSLKKQFAFVLEAYEHLQELNFSVEIEHCNSLQDVDGLDNHLFKYQQLLKTAEEEIRLYRNNFKKLKKQKKCYEEVIVYFKHEMGLMSEQLQNLQDLLTLSNDSVSEESSKLMQAFLNVQALNQQLSTQLTAAEQTVLLENQMNQLHEVKIGELERLVSEREINLGRHDQAIVNIRQTLQCSLKQNEELHGTIVSLNDTIFKLQNAIKKYETDNCKSREKNENCQAQINSCKEKLAELKGALEKKTAELCKLEMAYNNQNRTLKYAQMELKEMREKQKDKQCHLKCIIEELKDKQTKCEEKYTNAIEELQQVKTQLGIVTRKDAVKEVEIKRYRKIIGDLKKTLIELNKNLSKRNFKFESKCNNADCKKYMEQTGDEREQDICFNCPCEVEFYQSMVETLKKSVIELKKKLAETQKKNLDLEAELKKTESHLAQISHTQMERDREHHQLKQQLMEKLQQAGREESRYMEMANQFERELGNLRQELEVKTLQLDECKRSAQEINGSRCVQLACAQEEVNSLKEEVNNLLRKHCALNVENERLHSQSQRMQSTVTNLEDTSQLLKSQLEQYLAELQQVHNEKDVLMQKNRDLLVELRTLHTSYISADKQQRELRSQGFPEVQRACPRRTSCLRAPPTCQSPWSLGSQGTVSLHDDSPSRSPCPNECDWYSSTFRNESEDEEEEEEEEEEDWVSKVENLAAQVRQTNRMWKNKMGNADYAVSKDVKK